MSRISSCDGTKRYYQPVKHRRKWTWKDCTSQNCRTLFGFRLCWLRMTKGLFGTNGQPSCQCWRHQWDYIMIRRWELETSELGARLLREEQHPRVAKGKEPNVERENWRLVTVEAKRTVCQGRLMSFHPWLVIWRQVPGWKGKRPVVFSSTPRKRKDWQAKTLRKIRQ